MKSVLETTMIVALYLRRRVLGQLNLLNLSSSNCLRAPKSSISGSLHKRSMWLRRVSVEPFDGQSCKLSFGSQGYTELFA